MKRIIILGSLLLATVALADGYHYVRPYVDRYGSYHQGHYQTNPDSSRLNNWSTEGNSNPFTGRSGSESLYDEPSYRTRSYQPLPRGNSLGLDNRYRGLHRTLGGD